jgi:TRAP-type transport system periplasmic protein
MTKWTYALAAATAASLTMAGLAEARELRVASGAPPPHPATSHLYTGLMTYLPETSGGAMTATMLGPEVVSLGQMKDALLTGLIDVGNLLPLYFPAELPNFALAGELSLSGTDPQAMGAALTEYTVNCASCQQEMTSFGIVYLGSGSSDPYVLLTKTPVHRRRTCRACACGRAARRSPAGPRTSGPSPSPSAWARPSKR